MTQSVASGDREKERECVCVCVEDSETKSNQHQHRRQQQQQYEGDRRHRARRRMRIAQQSYTQTLSLSLTSHTTHNTLPHVCVLCVFIHNHTAASIMARANLRTNAQHLLMYGDATTTSTTTTTTIIKWRQESPFFSFLQVVPFPNSAVESVQSPRRHIHLLVLFGRVVSIHTHTHTKHWIVGSIGEWRMKRCTQFNVYVCACVVHMCASLYAPLSPHYTINHHHHHHQYIYTHTHIY